ncbi:MAG: DNA-binding protein [Clostridiales bacterium]|jgi:predicted DNA-binding protein with PD1-like motif|nr:DNA-binding protein [Clostridiales bacterium]
MEYKRFSNNIVARIDKGEEILAALENIIEKENVALGSVAAIGAINRLRAGLFLPDTKVYKTNLFERDMEIVSLYGSITTKDGRPYIHIHISASDENGNVVGGHLNEAVVSLTCEMTVNIFDGRVSRRFDDGVGLNLLEF